MRAVYDNRSGAWGCSQCRKTLNNCSCNYRSTADLFWAVFLLGLALFLAWSW